MNTILDISHWLPDAGLKSVAVLAVAGIVVAGMKRRSAAARHWVCFLAVASLPVLPVLSWNLPGWRVLPGWMELPEPSIESISSTPSTPSTIPLPPRQIETAAPATPEIIPPAPVPRPAVQINAVPQSSPNRTGLDWRHTGLLTWLAGVLLALAPVVLGVFSLHRLERTSQRETGPAWLDLLGQLLTRLGFHRRVELLKAARRRMPMTWGVLRPKVLLPEESREWPHERRSVVLLHELAHAQRCDYLTHLIARLVCAFYWFNPLVWLMARRMVAERERACDDIVLRHGAKPADYAEQVLEISAGLSTGWLAGCGGVAMARPSNLESRLRAILDTKLNRAKLTRAAVFSTLLLLTAILVPLAMLQAAPGSPSANPGRTQGKQSEIQNPKWSWGAPTNGLRTRLVAEKNEFRAGEPVRIHIEVENVSNQPITFQNPTAPYFASGLIFLDETGYAPTFIGQLGQFMVGGTNLAPGQTMKLEQFDLTDLYYLRRPGRYTVQLPGEHPMPMPGMANVHGLPSSGKLSFEIVADATADADGDPVGRLLPLLPERWRLESLRGRMNRLRPGNNREEVMGRALQLSYGNRMALDSGVICLWVTDQLAAARAVPAGDTTPASEYLGQAGRFHVYFSADANALKDWPAAKKDILQALRNEPDSKPRAAFASANPQSATAPRAVPSTVVPFRNPQSDWGDPVSGISVRLSAAKPVWDFREPHFFNFAVRNQGKDTVAIARTQATGELEVDGTWYKWSQPVDVKSSPLNPGGQFDDIAVSMGGGEWRKDTGLFSPGTGKHTLRFAVPAQPVNGGPAIRVVSNPLEVEFRWAASATNLPVTFVPGDAPVTARIEGRVVDDETGVAVTNFTPQMGEANPQKPDEITWSLNLSGRMDGGEGRFFLQAQKAGQVWRILADGYLPQMVLEQPLTGTTPSSSPVVRLKRGGELRGLVLNTAGQPVAGARVVIHRAEGSSVYDVFPAMRGVGDTSGTTDATGRFVLRGVDGASQKVIVTSADGLMVQPALQSAPGQELKITLPRPATLIVRYDIPGDTEEAELDLQLKTGEKEMPLWNGVTATLKPKVANRGQIILTNLAPGTYEFSRMRPLKATGVWQIWPCDRRTVVLESGQTQQVDLIRVTGQRLHGEVTGLDKTKATTGCLFIRSEYDLGNPLNWSAPCFDALTFDKDGHFETALLEPGRYTVVANAYEPEANNGVINTAIRLPDYIGMTAVIVTATGELPPVKIELRPREEPAKAP